MSDMDLMDRILATARMRVPGVTQELLKLELFNTIDEFFRQTNAWRWETVIPLISGTQQYPMYPPNGSDMVQVMGVSYKGRPVPSVTDSGQGSVVRTRGRIIGFPDPPSYDTLFEPDVINSPGGVFSYSIFFPSYIELDIPPSADAATAPITVLMALTLNYQVLEDEANEWPLEEWMYSTFHEAWIDGLQGRMFSQVSKPWSNTQMAQYHMKRFRKFMGRAKQMAEKGYVFNKPTWRFPQWA